MKCKNCTESFYNAITKTKMLTNILSVQLFSFTFSTHAALSTLFQNTNGDNLATKLV